MFLRKEGQTDRRAGRRVGERGMDAGLSGPGGERKPVLWRWFCFVLSVQELQKSQVAFMTSLFP